MDNFFIDILKILGALAFFIYGMKTMSEGIQRAAGSQMRSILQRLTHNRFFGLFSGFTITGLIQSSSAFTVMTVSFVNAGLLTVLEASGLILGANVGTSITGWLVALEVSKLSLVDYALPLMFIGVPLLFFRRGKLRFWGEFCVGIALLILGLYFMNDVVPDLRQNSEDLRFLSNYANHGFLSTLLFIFVGFVITVFVQSSSAAMALTLVMCTKGWISYEIAAAMILGENIGTTLTAEIAALVGNVAARRTARIHTLFNVIGTLWMMLALPFFLQWIDIFFLQSYFGMSAYQDTSAIPLGIAAFHTIFNVVNAILLIGFLPFMVKIASKTIFKKEEVGEQFRLNYMDFAVKTPELSILEVQKEIAKYGNITKRMSGFARELLLSTDRKEQGNLLDRISKYEEITDKVEMEVTDYLTKIARDQLSPKLSVRVRGIMNISSDMERIGDIFYQIANTMNRKIENRIWFNQHQRNRLIQMFNLIDKAFDEMSSNLNKAQFGTVLKEKAQTLENSINNFKRLVETENLEDIKSSEYNINSALIYSSLFSSLEEIGNHIFSITKSIVGEL